jgi:hypothetical protein
MTKSSITLQKKKLLLIITLLLITSFLLVQPISQDPEYHNFADVQTILEIPNFWNVISNIFFLVFGGAGLTFLILKKIILPEYLSKAYFIFFAGIFLTGIGSAYYHLNPNNQTLVWDRLPMTISFMAFFCVVIGEYIDKRRGRSFLFPLLFFGIASVLYWQITENSGKGDLRFYALIQFLPLILIPIILLSFKANNGLNSYIWTIILVYLLSKICEVTDLQIYSFTGITGGHPIKHLLASLTPLLLLIAIKRRAKSFNSKV